MQFDIQARGFTLTDAMRAHCERRLRFALGRAGGRLHGIGVRLSDVNGPRGGVDKRCILHATATGMPPLVITHDETDIYAAVDHAADRLARVLTRQMKRNRHDRRVMAWQSREEPDYGISPA